MKQKYRQIKQMIVNNKLIKMYIILEIYFKSKNNNLKISNNKQNKIKQLYKLKRKKQINKFNKLKSKMNNNS